jgi:hypothetical protein
MMRVARSCVFTEAAIPTRWRHSPRPGNGWIEREEGKPTGQPRCEAVGRWGLGQLCGSSGGRTGSGRIYRDRRSPERVWTLGSVTLLVLPLESLPAALTVKGAGGEKQQGRTPTKGRHSPGGSRAGGRRGRRHVFGAVRPPRLAFRGLAEYMHIPLI